MSWRRRGALIRRVRATFSRKREKGLAPLPLAGEGWGEGNEPSALHAFDIPIDHREVLVLHALALGDFFAPD